MAKIILSINAGSSSVKVSVFSSIGPSQRPTQIAEAQIDGLTAPPPKLKYQRGDVKVKGKELDKSISSQEDAFREILEHLIKDEGLKELKHQDDVAYATHRVVHGGDYEGGKVIDGDTYKHIEELSGLAPL
jgi:acetate kinase